MPPNQPDRADYNFILNPPKKPKRNPLNSGDFKQRLMIVLGGATILIILIMVVTSLLFGGNDNTTRLVSLLSQQQELVRISEQGEKDASSTETKNYASTVNLSMTSAQNEVTAHLGRVGHKVNSRELASPQAAKNDEALVRAGQTNRYDEVFNELIKTSLQQYQRTLDAAHNSSGSRSEKELLQKLFTSAETLSQTVPGLGPTSD